MGLISRVSSRTYRITLENSLPTMLDFEKAKANGQILSTFDEQRLRMTQLRRARKLYLNTMTLSDREPLWKHGKKGVDQTSGMKPQTNKWRLMRTTEDIGIQSIKRLFPDYKPYRGDWNSAVVTKNGLRDLTLSGFRQTFIRWPIYGGLFLVFQGAYYTMEHSANVHFHNFGPIRHLDRPAECLPEDNKLVARMCDMVEIRAGRGMALLPEGKVYPIGTRYDWLSGEPVLSNDENYYWVDGKPCRKDRGYFNPGPADVMGKRPYEADEFFDENAKPRQWAKYMPGYKSGEASADHH